MQSSIQTLNPRFVRPPVSPDISKPAANFDHAVPVKREPVKDDREADLVLKPLILAITEKKRPAFSQFYKFTVAGVTRLAKSILVDPHDCEEVVGDIYLQVWQSACRYDPERASVMGWLLMITRSRSLDKLRRRSRFCGPDDRQALLQESPVEAGPCPELFSESDEERHRIRALINELPELPRRTLVMNFYQELSHKEIALRLALPLGTVKSYIRRSLKLMGKRYLVDLAHR